MSRVSNRRVLVTAAEIDAVWRDANFGPHAHKEAVVARALLQYASGYCSGKTSTGMLYNLGLLTKKSVLTPRGQFMLHEYFVHAVDVCPRCKVHRKRFVCEECYKDLVLK